MKKEKLTYKTEEQQEMKKFLIILFIVVVIIVGVYGLSKVFIKEETKDLTYQTGEVSTDKVIVGTMLKKPEKEYYVLAYDTTGNNKDSYQIYAGYYTQINLKGIKIYYLDLNDVFNEKYYVKENSNPKATNIKDLKMLDGTLLKIENGKITKYIEGIEEVQKELKVEK